MKKSRRLKAFTITELLVAITVIGILASITLVVYPGYQIRNQNDQRKSDLSQIAAALKTYAIQKNNFVGTDSGCGYYGDGNGWIALGPNQVSSYPKAILVCLQEAGIISQYTDFIDPSGCLWNSGGRCGSYNGQVKAYMKASCTKSGAKVTYVFAYLENEPAKNAEVDALCDSGSVENFDSDTQKWGTHWGMNYYVSVN